MEGCELKLHRLTADKKLQKVKWSLLSETGQKKMTACLPLQSAQLCFILFYLLYFRQNSFSILMLGWGCIFKEDYYYLIRGLLLPY